jgi:hypothetical protein
MLRRGSECTTPARCSGIDWWRAGIASRGGTPACLGTTRLAGDSRRERMNRIGDGSAVLGPRPGRRVDHRSVPPAHGGAWTLRTKRGRGLRFRLRSTEVASRMVFGSTGGAGQGRLRDASDTFTVSLACVGVTNHPDRDCFGRNRARVGDDNGRRARAAVMRYGCRRGECFEGYEPRCEERRV